MDGSRFDTLTRALTTARSRRGLGQLLGALAVGSALGQMSLPDAEARRRKKKKRKKANKGGQSSPPPNPPAPPAPPVPPPSCPQAAAPHWCASARSCVPACPEGKVFDSATCTCVCLAQPCCQCVGGNNPFCSATSPSREACADECVRRNPNHIGTLYPEGSGASYACFGPEICVASCTPDACNGADACQGGANPCHGAGACFQPLGGGPTRCGISAGPASCGCTNHQQCANAHGIGAFCAAITGPSCGCPAGAGSSFCALPSPNV